MKKPILFSLLAFVFSVLGLISSCQEQQNNEKIQGKNGQWQYTTEARKDEVRVEKIETQHFYQYSFTTIRDIKWLDTYMTKELNIDPNNIVSIYMVYNNVKGWNSYRVVVIKK